MLTLDMKGIVTQVGAGVPIPGARDILSLWNHICLTNLRFAVGTGQLACVPRKFLGYCATILDTTEAQIGDAIVVAEIELLDIVIQPDAQMSLETGRSHTLEAWATKWKHLFSKPSRAAAANTELVDSVLPEFSYHFAYLVLSRRLCEALVKADFASRACARDYAHECVIKLAETFMRMEVERMHELSKFYHFCITYSALAILEFTLESPLPQAQRLTELLQSLHEHYIGFNGEVGAMIGHALQEASSYTSRLQGLDTVGGFDEKPHVEQVGKAASRTGLETLAHAIHDDSMVFPTLEEVFFGDFSM